MGASTRTWSIALGLLALGLGIRVYGLDWGLPQVYEEAYPFKKSWDMWGWGDRADLDLNPHFFNYPTFYFYIQLVGQGLLYLVLKTRGLVETTLDYRVLYELDKTPFYMLGRSISALFGAATVVVTFFLGRRIGGLGVGIASAVLVAVNGTHIQKSQVIEVDVPLTCLALLCCFFAVRILERPTWRNYLLAGVFGGLATSTKYSGALLPLPILLAHFWSLAVSKRSSAKRHPKQRVKRKRKDTQATEVAWFLERRWKLLGAAAVFVLCFLLTSPYALLDRQAFWAGLNYERLHMRIGHFGLDETPAILYYLRTMTGSLLGWPLTLLGGAGIVHALLVRRKAWGAVLAIFPIVYLVLISSWSMKAERYILPLVPITALFAMAFAAELGRALGRLSARLPAVTTALLCLVAAAPTAIAYSKDAARLRQDTRTLALEWFKTEAAGGSFVVSEAYGPEVLSVIELHNMDEEVRQRIRASNPDTKVYALQKLPMFQVFPEASSPFYDLRLYDDTADYVVTSSSVGSRYLREPARFATQVAFYDSLEKRYRMLREFGPQDGRGPRIRIYHNPNQTVPFASRKSVQPPPPLPVVPDRIPGVIGSFYQRFGINYESWGFHEPAVDTYLLGLRYADQPGDIQRSLILGAIRCALGAGKTERALGILSEAESRSKSPQDRAYWNRLRGQVQTTATDP